MHRTSVEQPHGIAGLVASEGSSDSEAVELTFWKSVEAGNDPAEYQAYLDRYPAGTFSALAAARLASPPTEAAAPPDNAVELAFWNSVKDSDDPDMFEAYLTKFPEGEFKPLAELRVAALERDQLSH